MKKISLILFVLFGAVFAVPALATSGACSGHGGVNCFAGSDFDGSVICYDGWRGSSVSYSSMEMCQGNIMPYVSKCIYPTALGCTTEYDYSSKVALNANSGLIGSSFGQANLSQCRQQIDDYNRKMAEYNQCFSDLINQNNSSSYQPPSPPTTPPPTYVPTYSDNYYQTQCETKIGSNAKYDTVAKKCGCFAGYKLNEFGSTCILDTIKPPVQVYVPPVAAILPVNVPVVSPQIEVAEPIKIVPPTIVVPKKYVSTIRRINVRFSASSKAKILGMTVGKKEYELLEEKPGWVKVQFGNKIGWIMRNLVVVK